MVMAGGGAIVAVTVGEGRGDAVSVGVTDEFLVCVGTIVGVSVGVFVGRVADGISVALATTSVGVSVAVEVASSAETTIGVMVETTLTCVASCTIVVEHATQTPNSSAMYATCFTRFPHTPIQSNRYLTTFVVEQAYP